jgi:dTDP-glucose 4,6-dehydratase
MRLLVTGGAGFLGSHFIRSWLAAHPTDTLVNLDGLTYAGSIKRLEDVAGSPHYRFVRGDIADSRLVQQAMQEVEVVVHFAAETHVDRSITDAAPFLRTNVEGTYVLLHVAQASGVKRFIHISTDEVYGPVLEGAVDETAPLAPRSPYAASKAAADLLVQAFRETFRLPTVIVRPTNIFGPAQFPEKFIPLCIANALTQQPIPLYGDGQQRRAWLFVDDFCEALRVLIERAPAGEVYNLGSGCEQANRDTATRILTLMGCSTGLIQSVADRPGHDRRYALNDGKLQSLGWRPQRSFEQALEQTIAWYRAHEDWWRPLTQALREDPYHWLNRTPRSGAGQAARVLR